MIATTVVARSAHRIDTVPERMLNVLRGASIRSDDRLRHCIPRRGGEKTGISNSVRLPVAVLSVPMPAMDDAGSAQIDRGSGVRLRVLPGLSERTGRKQESWQTRGLNHGDLTPDARSGVSEVCR